MFDNNLFPLGNKIKKAREVLKLSTTEIAKELQCSQQTISYIENNKAFGKNLVRYLYFLKEKGVDMNDLFE